MKLHEEFKEYETMWESVESSDTVLIESSAEAYKMLMQVQGYIENTEGWEIIDCQQDDEESMTLKCKVEYDIEEAEEDIIEFGRAHDVDVSINLSDRRGYDVIVYLSYEG
jgi:hypothetical protein